MDTKLSTQQGYDFTFHGLGLTALPSGALWWRAGRALMAADLHLGRAWRSTRDGGLPLPAVEAIDTLKRLQADIATHAPEKIFLLGDTLDAAHLADLLPAPARDTYHRLREDARVTVLSGNHDATGCDTDEVTLGAVTLRHIAGAGTGADISGHYHPKLRFQGQLHPVFLVGAQHLVLPAYGTFTGGLAWPDPALLALVPDGLAIVRAPTPYAVPLGKLRKG